MIIKGFRKVDFKQVLEAFVGDKSLPTCRTRSTVPKAYSKVAKPHPSSFRSRRATGFRCGL